MREKSQTFQGAIDRKLFQGKCDVQTYRYLHKSNRLFARLKVEIKLKPHKQKLLLQFSGKSDYKQYLRYRYFVFNFCFAFLSFYIYFT